MLFDDDQLLLGPYATTPPRIADEIAGAIAAVGGARAVALFGSLAAGTHDGFSDVDMLVAYDGYPAIAARCAGAIDEAKPVRYYRPFTDVDQPSGRYWFDGDSPFHHLDVSFYSTAAYDRVRREGRKEWLAIESVEVWRATSDDCGGQRRTPAARVPARIAESEWERHGRFGYFLVQARRYLRGTSERDEFDVAWAEFRDQARGVRFDTRTPAGRLGEMIQACWQIHAAIDRAERGG
ncbi:MAG: nucleotidyltransferase domain-containing protein [Chloroflexi bacterium]|nr:nucleotidyltransferase domain-containing protein [Chloroflexota bacterium]